MSRPSAASSGISNARRLTRRKEKKCRPAVDDGPASRSCASYQRVDLSFSSFIYSYTMRRVDIVVCCWRTRPSPRRRRRARKAKRRILYASLSRLSRSNLSFSLFFFFAPFDPESSLSLIVSTTKMKFVHRQSVHLVYRIRQGRCETFLQRKRERDGRTDGRGETLYRTIDE